MATGGACGGPPASSAPGVAGEAGNGGRIRERGKPLRQAVSGMIEALILTGIMVASAGVLAVWMGAFEETDRGIYSHRDHCTADIVMFDDIGGGANFFSLRVTNTGEQTIHGVQVVTDNAVHYSNSSQHLPGTELTVPFTLPHAQPESVEVVVGYADGSTSFCAKRLHTGVS